MEQTIAPRDYDARLSIRGTIDQDDQKLREIINIPLTTKGVLLSFQREPSYFQASKVIYKQNDHSVIEDDEQKMVACFSNGSRPCYVNQKVQNMRYACDLRVVSNYRSKAVLQLVAKRMRETMQDPDFAQNIIFDDNYAARAAIQASKFGLPQYYAEGSVETLTLTGFQSQKKIRSLLEQQQRPNDLSRVTMSIAEPKHIEQMNRFIQKMAQHYNFIPAYDFNELLDSHPYFLGLNLKDFRLYFDENQTLIGMYGLWDQHLFKQSKIVDYGKIIGFARPFYNVYSSITAKMTLPKRGQSFHYHALHSLLCEPNDLALHHKMLQDAFDLSKQKGIPNICFTLSKQDPRYQLNQFYKGEVLTGTHGYVSFNSDPRPNINAELVPYFEVGRI